MQLSRSSLLMLAAPLVAKLADVAQIVPFVTAFYSDFKGNTPQYLSYVGAGGSIPPIVLQLYEEVSTYTDDSYTTLISSDFPIDQLSGWITGLPWYSTRLEGELAAAAGGAATTTAASSSAEAASTTAAALSTSSSAPAETSSSASSVLSSAISSATSAAAESSSSSSGSAAPSVAESSSSSGAGGIAGNNVNPMILVPLVALSAGAFLL